MDAAVDERVTDFGVVHEGYRMLHMALERELDARGLGPFAWHEILMRLMRGPAEQLPVTDLARQVLIPLGSFTRILDRMEGAGLLERRPSLTSRRTTLITLTEAGRQRARRSAAASATCLQAHLFDHLTAEQRGALVTVMGIVRAANGGW